MDSSSSSSSSRAWTFSVRVPATASGEVVCLSGSADALGRWSPDDVLPMERMWEAEVEGDDEVWTVGTEIPLGVDVSYRFCVCVFVPPTTGNEGEAHHDEDSKEDAAKETTSKKVVVRRWETDLKPRKIRCHDCCTSAIDTFGSISSPPRGRPVLGGWLCHETLVELKLLERSSVHLWRSKHRNKEISVKITPVDVNTVGACGGSASSRNPPLACLVQEESVDIADYRERSPIWPAVHVANLADHEPSFRAQNQFGAPCRADGEDLVVFQVQLLDPSTVALLVDFYGREPGLASAQPEHLGSCYVLPNHFKSTEGRVQMPILSVRRFQPIGQFEASFLIVRPMPDFRCDLSASFVGYWKQAWSGMDVGHRGMGDSYNETVHCANIMENTVASLKNAAAHGADTVEFDVQVSKDLVPVVYHNFELMTSVESKRGGGDRMLVRMPLKELTLEQLQSLKTHHLSESAEGIKDFSDHTTPDHEPFPTLERVFKEIDPHVGFNIEIKKEGELVDGSPEVHHIGFELNEYIDVILRCVLRHAGTRKIFFSTFNPDLCTVLRRKQNKYPVLFLTQADSKKWKMFRDPRCWSVPNASKFAAAAELLGVNVIAEKLLGDPSLVADVKSRGQVLFCWMDDKNDRETVDQLRKMGVDGLIYDRMDVNNPKDVKESIFLVEDRKDKEQQGQQQQEQQDFNSGCSCKSGASEEEEEEVEETVRGERERESGAEDPADAPPIQPGISSFAAAGLATAS